MTKDPLSGGEHKNAVLEGAVEIVHRLPHRTRVKLRRRNKAAEQLEKIEKRLRVTPGVQSIEINPSTGSMLVFHDTKPQFRGGLYEAINELSQILAIESGAGEVPDTVYRFVHAIDEKLSAWSNHSVELKAVLPLSLFYIGLKKVSTTGSLLGEISPLVLFYYAFDSYLKLYRRQYLPVSDVPVKEAGATR